MKKALFLAAAMAACLTVTAEPVQVQAAKVSVIPVKKQITVNGNTWKDCLENLDFGNWNVITIPCLPGTDTDKPGTDVPDTDTPDTDKPETDKPGADELPQQSTYAIRVAELVNEERAKAGLKALTLKADIGAAAQVRAVETETLFSHTRPDGSSFATALSEAGVSYRGAGENIAWGQKTPEQVMEGWMNSPGHRANILNEKYTSIGIGYYRNVSGVNYWTQLFTF